MIQNIRVDEPAISKLRYTHPRHVPVGSVVSLSLHTSTQKLRCNGSIHWLDLWNKTNPYFDVEEEKVSDMT